MNVQIRPDGTDTGISHGRRRSDLLRMVLCLLLLSVPSVLLAQVPEQLPEQASAAVQEPLDGIEEVVVSLPDSQQMALALASPGSRQRALLDLATAASVLSRAGDAGDPDYAALAKSFVDDRGWLQMLIDRHGWVQPHSAILDPAAWLVAAELRQHDLEDMDLVFPGSTPGHVLIQQVFQRTGPRLAAANLPVLLFEIEARAISLWDDFLRLTGPEGAPDAAWKEVETTWFTDRQMPPSPAEDDASVQLSVVENIPLAMSKLVLDTIGVRPPDSRALVQLRYSILNKAQELTASEDIYAQDQARDALYLVNLVDGLHDGRYFEFVRGLLALTTNLSERPTDTRDVFSVDHWLVAELPAISAQYAADFASVDPGLNAAMAASYQLLQGIEKIHHGDPDTADVAVSDPRTILADAVAKMALLIPDMAYYFDTPVRSRVTEEINICISIAASRDESGNPAMTRGQFNACLEALLQLADRDIRLPELSGDVNGPFTNDALRRELSIGPWQRINYGIGYLHDRYPSTCQPPAMALPNPLEWAVLATTMTWLAEHSPDFFNTPQNESRLTKMRAIGEQVLLALAEQSGCLATASGLNDPVSRSLVDYELALRELDAGIKSAELDFRSQRLHPGADVSLDKDALQRTSYRPDDLVIKPCDAEAVCDMSADLSTTRALIGLFPDEYLIAQQTGMGHIEICYQNMEWVQRRSELVRADDDNVANYFGRLGFDLVGRYVENDDVNDIFGFRFTSPDEYHYLFAQASEDVLNDSCPVEWVGSRVVTPLRERRGGIVPDRLTYLAASRNLPSQLLQNNWDQGAEWRDWFVTGLGVSPLEVPASQGIMTRLNQHLQSLYQAEQSEVYQRVLLPAVRNSQGDDVSLFTEVSQVSIAKALIRTQMMLFYPESIAGSDAIRTAIAGDAGLLDGRVLRRFREDNVALTSVNAIARERLNKLRKTWSAQPPAVRRQGSIPPSMVYALIRMNALYRQFFTSRPEPLQEIEVTAKPRN